jgi:hypothetical protein
MGVSHVTSRWHWFVSSFQKRPPVIRWWSCTLVLKLHTHFYLIPHAHESMVKPLVSGLARMTRANPKNLCAGMGICDIGRMAVFFCSSLSVWINSTRTPTKQHNSWSCSVVVWMRQGMGLAPSPFPLGITLPYTLSNIYAHCITRNTCGQTIYPNLAKILARLEFMRSTPQELYKFCNNINQPLGATWKPMFGPHGTISLVPKTPHV